MGQSNSNIIPTSNALSIYDEVDVKSEYGTIVSHKTTKEIFLFKEMNFPDQDEYKKSLKHYESRKVKPYENVLNLVQLQNQSKSLFCSEIYRLSLIYEFAQITLADQVEARKHQLRYFEEQDIWSIMQSCLYGLIEISETILLQPNRIYVMTDGLVKIVDPDLITNNSWYMLDQNIYYSPQRFHNFGNSNKVSTTEQESIFALGATLLHTAILQDCFDCYEYGAHRFNEKRLNYKLEKLQKLYSEDLKTVICGLLEFDPNQRMTIKQLQQIIGKVTAQQTEEQSPYVSYQQVVQAPKEHRENREQPFKQVTNDHRFQQYQQQRQPQISYPAPNIKFKNVQIKTVLEPITQYNPTRQNTKFQPNFSNYKQIQQSQYQSILHGHTTQFAHHINTSPLPMYFDARLDSVRSKNINDHNQSKYFEKKQNYEVFRKDNQVYTKKDNDQNLFTDPRLLEQIRRDMNQITARRSLASSGYPSGRPSYHHHHQKSNTYIPESEVKQNKNQLLHEEEDGKVFEGTKVYGMKQGFGKLTYPEGPFYLGDFVDDKMHGKGVLYYEQNKPAYDGEWFQDQFHGKGKLYNENPLQQNEAFDYTDFNLVEDYWSKYQGEFIHDNKQGFGKLFLSNGEVFQGCFEKDCVNGEGIFYNRFGQKYHGIWNNNVLEQRFQRR